MKRRFVSLFMVLILAVPLLLVGVSAADDVSDRYVFQYVDSGVFVCSVPLPPGCYSLSFLDFDFGTIYVSYDLEFDGFLVSLHQFVFTDDVGDSDVSLAICSNLDDDSGAIEFFLDGFPFDLGHLESDPAVDLSDPFFCFVFVPFEVGLSSYLSPDSFSIAMDEVLLLIPVVLGVTVSYIGIRKGIAWLTQVLRNS